MRYGFLDALRGCAVALVLIEHIGEQHSAALRRFSAETLGIGQFGVMIFFLCSGFIIPASLERGGSLRRFAVGRFFRLYPLYWFSLSCVLLLSLLGTGVAAGLTVRDWLANITMAQVFLGSPDALGPYWTLAWELLFYVLMASLFIIGWHRRSTTLALFAAAVVVLFALLGFISGFRIPLAMFNVSSMFAGAVIFRWFSGVVRFRVVAMCSLATLSAGAILILANNSGGFSLANHGIGMYSAWVAAYAAFLLGIWWWRGRTPSRALTGLGRISYSVYLMHGLVLAAIPIFAPWGLSVVVTLVLIFAISAATYRWIEKPAVSMGRRGFQPKS